MSIVINGSGTVTGLSVGGLPDGTVDAGTLATNSVDSAELIDGAVDDSHMASISGRKNILINGDFRINQRGLTTSAVAVTNGAYNTDRMKNYLVGISGTVAIGSSEAVDGSYETPLKYTAGSTASGRLGGFQAVEDYHYGETLTASAWVKSDNANARIVAYDGQTETTSNTHTGGGAWEKLTVTFTQRTNADQLYIWCAIISSSVGSVSIASGDYIYISKFQCERGSVATAFERRNIGEELALCQRYYLKDTGTGYHTAIGQNTDRALGIAWMLPVPFRASPTITVSGTSYALTHTTYNGTSSPSVHQSAYTVNESSIRVGFTGFSGITDNRLCAVELNTVTFDAEL